MPDKIEVSTLNRKYKVVTSRFKGEMIRYYLLKGDIIDFYKYRSERIPYIRILKGKKILKKFSLLKTARQLVINYVLPLDIPVEPINYAIDQMEKFAGILSDVDINDLKMDPLY